MQTLHIIFTIVASLAYAAMTFFAVSAWFTLRRMERRQKDMFCNSTNALMLLMGQQLKSEMDQLTDMQRDLNSFVEREQYEAAKQMKAIIKRQQKTVSRTIENMRQQFGDAFKVEKSTITLHPQNDDDE